MRYPADPGPDERPASLLGRSAPAGMAVRVASIPAHGELAYEPSERTGALVSVGRAFAGRTIVVIVASTASSAIPRDEASTRCIAAGPDELGVG